MTPQELSVRIDAFIRTQTDSAHLMLHALTDTLCTHLALSRRPNISDTEFKTLYLELFESRLDKAFQATSQHHATRHN